MWKWYVETSAAERRTFSDGFVFYVFVGTLVVIGFLPIIWQCILEQNKVIFSYFIHWKG
jgi:hypothetical protein